MVSPIAETTTTTWCPANLVSTMRWATRLTLAASARLEPPNFCTIKDTSTKSTGASRGHYPPVTLSLHPPPAFKSSTQGNFIGILKVATDRKATC